MAKTKKKNIHLPLVVTGYTLFVLLLISVFFSTTLPFVSILSHPSSLKINASIAMISLTIGALLPVLVGYGIGDRSIKSKSKLTHHFNGILFGLLAYWFMVLTTLFMTIPPYLFPDMNIYLVLVNILPGICVAIATFIIAFMHVRSKQAKHDVLEYKPFVFIFVISILVMSLASSIYTIATNTVNFSTFFAPLMIAVIGLIVYMTLRKLNMSKLQKIGWTAVSLSVLYVAMFVVYLCESALMSYVWQPSADIQAIGGWAAYAVAIGGWLLYWACQVKALGSVKK